MESMDYKERLEALRRAGFTTLEITRLYQFRRAYMANELDQTPAVRPLARGEREADGSACLKPLWPSRLVMEYRMQLSENARRVLEARYLRRDAQGKLSETPDQLFISLRRIVGQVLQLGAGEEPYEKEHASKCDPYQCKL
jgi:hypothetical protein